MEHLTKKIAAFMLAIIVFTALAGCNRSDGGNTDSTETSEISKIDLSSYSIVYSDKASNYSEKELAVSLKKRISEEYGTDMPMETDWLAAGESYDDSAKQILVGMTAYPQTDALKNELTREDFAVKPDGCKIVILGGTSEKLDVAIDYFMDNYITRDSENILTLKTYEPYIFRHEYKFPETVLSVVSLNLRTATSATANNQSLREPRIVEFIKDKMPDSIGTQECTAFWRTRLDEEFGKLGYSRAQLTHSNPQAMKNYIWYNPSTVSLVDSGYIWLSETPDFASKGFGSEYYISASWAILESKATGVQYIHVNTHLDYTSEDIRLKELDILLSAAGEFIKSGYPVFITGDFNAREASPTYEKMLSSGVFRDFRYAVAAPGVAHTFNKYETEENEPDTACFTTIDYGFYSGAITPVSLNIYDKYSGGYMSDHNALCFDMKISGGI